MYLTYNEYRDMGGTLDETAYTRLEYKARKLIDTYTFGRVKALESTPESVKMLMFELVALGDQDDNGGPVSSVSNDGYSESYAITEIDAKAENLIRSYLAGELDTDGTPLLYRGVVTLDESSLVE